MSTIDRSLRRVFDEERAAAQASRGVLTSITQRATRRRAGRLAGATVVALGVAGLAATSAVSLGHHVAPAVPPETVLGTVTLPFGSAFANPFGPDGAAPTPLGVACGDPAPTPVTSADGIEWDVASPPGTLYPGAGITTTLRSTGGETAPASVSLLGFVIVRDGVVAGWKYNSEFADSDEFRYLDSFSFDHVRGTIDAPDEVCPGQGSEYFFAPGDTEWYPIVHVTASPEIAARQYLKLQGFSVPGDSPEDLAMYSPGSWDCERLLAPPALGAPPPPDMPRPTALCAPLALEGVTVDRGAKTITVPYTARLYTRSLDVTLVGNPLTFTQVATPDTPGSLGFDMSPAAPVADTAELTCGAHIEQGANFSTGRTSVAVEQSAIEQLAQSPFGDGTTLRLAVVPPSLSPPATVTYPAPLRVWFLASAPESPDRPTRVQGPGYTVVGTGTAIVNGGAPLALDRFRGPSIATVTFSESAWCPSSRPVATTVIAFEGVERVGTGAGTETQSTVFDFWSASFSDWMTLGGAN